MSVSFEPGRFVLWRWQWSWQPKTARQWLIFFGALLVFISSIFVLIAAPAAYRGHRLSTEGRPATGTVVKKVLHRAAIVGKVTPPPPTKSITSSPLPTAAELRATTRSTRTGGIGSMKAVRLKLNMPQVLLA